MPSRFLKTRLSVTLAGLSLTLAMLLVQLGHVPVLDEVHRRLELLSFDLRLKALLAEAAEPHPQVAIVDIDEASLRSVGRWPWSRDKVAALLERLTEAGAAVVGFDILFAEAESNIAETVAAAMDPARPEEARLRDLALGATARFDYDGRLAAALDGTDVVLGYLLQPLTGVSAGELPPPLPLRDPSVVARSSLLPMGSYTGSLPRLQQAAAGGGFFTPVPDLDGIIRRVPLLARYGDEVYASLALEVVRLYQLIDQVDLVTAPLGAREAVEGLRLAPGVVVPTDEQARMIVPFVGEAGSFRYFSAADVMAGEVAPEALANAIVLVGTTAAGLFDLRATPVQSVYPGVEIHANLIAAMLDRRFLVVPAWAAGADTVVLLLVGILLTLLLPRLSPLAQLGAGAAVAGSVLAFNLSLWQGSGLVLSLAAPLLLAAFIVSLNVSYGFLFESSAKRQLKGMFGQYVPPQLVEEMSSNPDAYNFDGDTREMSVLFADIRGFTTLSERLTANALKQLLNRYLTPMTKIIFDSRGTIDKYVGDMIMAFWGAPLADPRHAVQAIDAALQMKAATAELSARFQAEGLPAIDIGVGINTGLMNVGDMGSEYRRAYTVLGDAVNLASRLESSTKFYGVGILVGEATRAQAAEVFLFRAIDRVRVKGKAQAIEVYQPLCRVEEAGAALREELARHQSALAAYRACRWDEAERLFAGLREARPDVAVYAMYLERIAGLRSQPLAADWDGVYERTGK